MKKIFLAIASTLLATHAMAYLTPGTPQPTRPPPYIGPNQPQPAPIIPIKNDKIASAIVRMNLSHGQIIPLRRTLTDLNQGDFVINIGGLAQARQPGAYLELIADNTVVTRIDLSTSLVEFRADLRKTNGVDYSRLILRSIGSTYVESVMARIAVNDQEPLPPIPPPPPGATPNPYPNPNPPVSQPPISSEEVLFTEIIQGLSFSTSTTNASVLARDSYDQNCMNWKNELYRSLPGIRDIQCGNITDIGGSNAYMYSSEGHVTVLAPRDRQSYSAVLVGAIISTSTSNARSIALSSFEELCRAYKAEMINLNLGRLVYVSCGKMNDTGGSNSYRYRSETQLVVASVGQTRTVSEDILGYAFSTSQSNARAQAMDDFNRRCNEWKSNTLRYFGRQIVTLSCGEPTDVGGSSSYQYKGAATAVLSQY